MSISDTQSAKKYASIAEVAAAQAKAYALELENAPDYASEAQAAATAAAASSDTASQYASNAATAAASSASSANDAANSAAEAAGAAGGAIGQTVRAPTGESLTALPAAASRINQFIVTGAAGDVEILSRDSVPVLGLDGKLPVSVIPAIALTEPFVVNSEAAMLALDAQPGDIVKRTDLGYSFCLAASPASTLSNWVQLTDDVLAQLGLSSGATQVGATSLSGASSTVQAELDKKPDSTDLAASTGATKVGATTDSGATTTVQGALGLKVAATTLAGTGSGQGVQGVGYKSSLTGAVARTAQSKFDDIVSVKDFGAKGDGATDDTSAIVAAHATGIPVYYPAGVYLCASKVSALSKPFGIIGDGQGIVEIRFTSSLSANAGFYHQPSAGEQFHHVEGVRITTLTAPVAGKEAIYLDCSLQVTPSGSTTVKGTTGSRSERRATIQDVTITGTGDGTANAWYNEIHITSALNFLIDNVNLIGLYAPDSYVGSGILIDGDGYVVDFRMQRLWVYSKAVGINFPDYIEAPYISYFELINCTRGILARYQSGISKLDSSLQACLGPRIGPGHINCRLAAIDMSNVNQALITGMNIHLNPLSGDSNMVGVGLQGGSGNILTSSNIAQLASNTNYMNGVLLNSSVTSTVRDTKIYNMGAGVGVNLINTSIENVIDGLYVNNAATVFNTDSTSTQNTLGKYNYDTISGTPVILGSDNNFVEQRTYVLQKTVTLTGGSTAEFTTISLPANMFKSKPVFAWASGDGNGNDLQASYNITGSSATSLVLRVESNNNATLTAGSYLLSIIVAGV